MNKAELITVLTDRLDGDRRSAATAVDGLLEVIVDTVRAGDPVSILGFGVFERRERAARSARNPRTGEFIDVPATAVPAFRPGAGFRNAVAGAAGATVRSPGQVPARPAAKEPDPPPTAGNEAAPIGNAGPARSVGPQVGKKRKSAKSKLAEPKSGSAPRKKSVPKSSLAPELRKGKAKPVSAKKKTKK